MNGSNASIVPTIPHLTPSANKTSSSDGTIEQVAYAIISVMSILGNTLVLLYFVAGRHILLKKPFNINILALAVTDTVTGILLVFSPVVIPKPFIRMTDLQSVSFYCFVIWERRGLFFFGFASIYLSVLLTIDRWIAVVKPTKYKRLVTSRRVGIGIVLAYSIALAIILQNRPALTIEPDKPSGQQCGYAKKTAEDLVRSVIMGYVGFAFKFCIPVALILVMYSHIVYTIKTNGGSNHFHGTANHRVIKRVTIIAAIISITLITCWMPNQINYFLFLIGKVQSVNNTKHKVTVLLAMSNSCWNPLLYGLASREYRKGYWSVLARSCPCLKAYHGGRVGTSSQAMDSSKNNSSVKERVVTDDTNNTAVTGISIEMCTEKKA